jgi:hypothetical protein
MFDALSRWTRHPHYTYCWDQALFDFAVRCDFQALHAAKCPNEKNGSALYATLHGDILGQTSPSDGGVSAVGRLLRWRPISYQLLPHPHKWYGSLPAQLPRDAVGFGGVVAVHLWSTISAIPPGSRIACARAMGFWTTPLPDTALRVGPFYPVEEANLPRTTLSLRFALVDMLARARRAREALLLGLGWGAASSRARLSRAEDELLEPYLNASFAHFVPLQPFGPGRLRDGSVASRSPPLAKNGNWSAPGGKCSWGYWVP